MYSLRPNPHRMWQATRSATQRKQMGPVDVNGGVHTACKQHQRINVRICVRIASRVLCGLGLTQQTTRCSGHMKSQYHWREDNQPADTERQSSRANGLQYRVGPGWQSSTRRYLLFSLLEYSPATQALTRDLGIGVGRGGKESEHMHRRNTTQQREWVAIQGGTRVAELARAQPKRNPATQAHFRD